MGCLECQEAVRHCWGHRSTLKGFGAACGLQDHPRRLYIVPYCTLSGCLLNRTFISFMLMHVHTYCRVIHRTSTSNCTTCQPPSWPYSVRCMPHARTHPGARTGTETQNHDQNTTNTNTNHTGEYMYLCMFTHAHAHACTHPGAHLRV